MCFSATASFVSSAALIGVGLVAMRKARGTKFKSLSAIPHLFGVQQLAEGFVWLGLQHEEYAPFLDMSSYGFLIFAWLIWPVYIPYTMRRFETNELRRRLMNILIGVGALVATALVYVLIFKGFHPEIRGHSIYYYVNSQTSLSWLISILYLSCTILPALISSGKKVWVLGVVTALMYLVAKIFYHQHLLSVWCFYAAIGSLLVLWVIHLNTRSE